jgi:2-polyprenyl-6-methoxyphenol hydroxylase-like FAD-dependent oxidoreductase
MKDSIKNKNVLISGAGIAGTTLAYWLRRFGFKPVIVEHAPKLRKGGYGIDFWGIGIDIAEKMGILPALREADLSFSQLTFVDGNGRPKAKLDYDNLKKIMNGRAYTLLRSDLARIIYDQLDKDIEMIFDDSVAKILETETCVRVTFTSGLIRDFDLVIGADGLHSKVRDLVFGDEAQFERYYGYYTASYTITERSAKPQTFQMYSVPGKQVSTYSTKDGKTTTFYIFSSLRKLLHDHTDVEAEKNILRNEFANAGWQCRELIASMDNAHDFYFDVVSQIQMSQWSKSRITLVGDACDCPSLLSGQGSTLAMVGAYVLAGELKDAGGNYETAFSRYQSKFKPFLDQKQKIAQSFAKSFVPKTKFAIWMRNMGLRLMVFPFVSKMFIKQFLNDNLELKNY